MNTAEIYETITNTIISLIETHQLSWNKPWISLDQAGDMAANPGTGNTYRGINQFLLSIMMMDRGYLKNQWMTFNQIKKEGGHVKKGEKSTPVIFFKPNYLDKEGKRYSEAAIKLMNIKQYSDLGMRTLPVVKLYRVFNLESQTEGLAPETYEFTPTEPLQTWEQNEAVENLIVSTGAKIEFKPSNRAYYSVGEDKITLPLKEQFKDAHFYTETALHEISHWTGAEHRLNRKFGVKNSMEYSQEELVAELSSAYCAAALGIEKTMTNNAAYLKSWLGIMKTDSKAIVRAASSAQKAADYILGGDQYAAYQKANNHDAAVG